MPKNQTSKIISKAETKQKEYEENEDYEDCSESESSGSNTTYETKKKPKRIILEKPKEKKPRTEKQMEAFLKAKAKREENIILQRELKQKELEHIRLLKEKAKMKKQNKIKKLEKAIEDVSGSEEETEERQKKKVIKKKTKKVVYVESETDDDDESSVEVRNKFYVLNTSIDPLNFCSNLSQRTKISKVLRCSS